MRKTKWFEKIYSVILSLVLVLQIFAPIIEATTTNQTSGNSSSVRLVSAQQDTSNEKQLDLKLQLDNTTDQEQTTKIDVSSKDNVKLKKVTNAALTASDNSTLLGQYQVTDSQLVLSSKANATGTVTLKLDIADDSSLTGTLQFELQSQEITASLKSASSSSSTSSSISSSSSDTNSSSSSTSSSSSATSSSASSSSSKVTRAVTVLAATSGNDITQYLPDTSNGTIINDATLGFTDSDGKAVDPTDVTDDTNLNFNYKWSIPNDLKDNYQIKGGDYFTFSLPGGIQYKAGTGTLGDYGTYAITSDGKVTFTFNDNVDNVNDISGDFHYTSSISSDSSSGKQDITIDTTDGPIDIPYVVKPTGGSDIAKAGTLTGANSSGNNPTGITWDVTINTSGQNLKNATVTDPLPAGTNLSSDSNAITIYPLTVDLKGKVTATGTALTEGTDYTVDKTNGKITFIGNYADTYQAFKIEYKTDIDSSSSVIPNNGGKVPFTNTATLTNNGKDSPASATVNANYGKLLEKSYDGQDKNGSQKYNWHINYNYGEKNLTSDQATLVDTLSDGQVFSGTPTLTYEDGTAVPSADYTVSYSADNSTMTIKFVNGLKQGVKVAYQSQVTAAIDGSTTINNSVSSDGQTTDTGEKTVSQQGLTKSLGSVDYNAKTVTWNFDINMAHQDMKNWSMTDPVPDGLTVDYNSFILKDKDTSVTLTNGTDYIVTPNGNGFTIAFKGNLANSAKDEYTLSYKTGFETQRLSNSAKWTNSATTTWYEQSGTEHTNNSSADFTPKTEFKNDGSKSGSYNAVSKNITWTVVTNYNQRTLTNAKIVDPIIGDQDYVSDSAKLYEATINPNGTYTLGNQVNTGVSYDSSSKTITANLPEGSTKAYVLTYDTTLADKVIDQATYDNSATYTNNSISSTLTAKVTVPNSGDVVEKTGQQDPTDAAYATWNIWVNKAQSTLTGVVVKDEPSDNQIIDQDSIVIYPGKVSANGSFTEDKDNPLQLGTDYTIDMTTDQLTGKQTLQIIFKNKITTAYSIDYRSLINSSLTNDVLTNTVSVGAQGEKDVSGNTNGTTKVVNNGGSATGKNTNLVITKSDADSKDAIAGATFELYADVSGKKGQLLRSGTTDTDGQLQWNNLKSGKYILVETSAPDGYVISSDLANGKEINVNYSDANSDNQVTQSITNEKGKITVEKTDSDTGHALAGATFDLYKDDGTLVKSGLMTDENGEISYSGLNAGKYYVLEKDAPAGYELDRTKHEFTVDGSDIQQKISVKDAETTGSVILTKTDSDTGKALTGATFDLYNADGTKVASGLTTDNKGQITYDDLKPGDYYFVETAAPAGYDFNKDTHYDFIVELQTTAKVATVSAGNAETTGSVVLTKTDSDTNQPLAGAIFDLYKADGTKVANDLTTDSSGQITYDNLKPGNYYFVETAAPAGYNLDSSKKNFTVELQETAKVATVSAANAETTGSVILTKTDSDTGEPLVGAIFDLYKKDGTKIESDLTTDNSGQIKVNGLKPGDYYFVETKAPAGYDLDNSEKNFTVIFQSTAQVATVSATNAETTGSVVLSKTDSDTGKALAGATFDLYKADGTKIANGLTTDAKGQIKVDDLKPGDYYFVETAAPAGYVLDSSKQNFTVELQKTVKVATVSATNAEKTGSVVLTKTDSDTGKALATATFDLYKADGTKIASGLTTDAEGQIKVDNLKPGDYYFVETKAPAGYVLDSSKQNFTVELQTTAKVAVVSAANAETTGSVILTKTDSDTGKALAGATFDLYKADGTKIASGLTTDTEGQIKVDNLKPGNYYFVETAAPAGYDFNKDTHYDFIVKLQTTAKVETVSATNAERTGSVVLTKTDSDTGKALAGAIFDLYKADGTKVASGLTTDAKGQIKVDNLKPGDYYFVETKAPDGYVLDSSKQNFTVVLQTVATIATVSATNKEKTGSVVLTKADGNTGKALVGAVFDLYKANGTRIASGITTNNKGQIKVDNLKPGDYYFKEVTAPKGYKLNSDKITFTIELQNVEKIVKLVVKDYPEDIPAKEQNNTNSSNKVDNSDKKQNNTGSKDKFGLPQTGSESGIWLSIMGSIVIVLVALFAVIRRFRS
ncbi:SpaA isopeptide-forming pilin-related protein [Liquorilactobacillus mali]|uniref:SpaA isopeptide-forming pilin-related protein n=3 Tax=Liquorilactobacillus mali TaxID=1618 RepID=UPI0002491B9D|nr:SpaA isopeptide-forming pilin-related protein [Liquorilactobacillus mali]QFQ75867.1 LPXTG cell wall anchor domain-containing protein [Liquorilactobacillus mali]